MSFQESFPGEKIIQKISANWTTVLILISTISSLLSLGWSQTSLYFASAEKRNQKTIANRTIVFLTLMMQVVSKVWQYQLWTFKYWYTLYSEARNLLYRVSLDMVQLGLLCFSHFCLGTFPPCGHVRIYLVDFCTSAVLKVIKINLVTLKNQMVKLFNMQKCKSLMDYFLLPENECVQTSEDTLTQIFWFLFSPSLTFLLFR